MIGKRIVDFASATLDTVMTASMFLGHQASRATLALRTALYFLQAVFAVVGRGHSKTTNS